jgi:hypothetical protein
MAPFLHQTTATDCLGVTDRDGARVSVGCKCARVRVGCKCGGVSVLCTLTRPSYTVTPPAYTMAACQSKASSSGTPRAEGGGALGWYTPAPPDVIMRIARWSSVRVATGGRDLVLYPHVSGSDAFSKQCMDAQGPQLGAGAGGAGGHGRARGHLGDPAGLGPAWSGNPNGGSGRHDYRYRILPQRIVSSAGRHLGKAGLCPHGGGRRPDCADNLAGSGSAGSPRAQRK